MKQTTFSPSVLQLQQLINHLQYCAWLPQYTLDGKVDLDELSRDPRLDRAMQHFVRELLYALDQAYASVQYWAGVHLGALNQAPEFLRQMGIRAQETRKEGEYAARLALSIPAGGCPAENGYYTVYCGTVNQ